MVDTADPTNGQKKATNGNRWWLNKEFCEEKSERPEIEFLLTLLTVPNLGRKGA